MSDGYGQYQSGYGGVPGEKLKAGLYVDDSDND